MPDITFPARILSGLPVVTAPAEIDVSNAGPVRTALLRALALGHATIVLDMTRTQFCDTAGLHVLVRAHKRALAERDELRLVISAGAVLHLFSITGLDRLIPHFPDLAAALKQTPAIAIQPVPRIASPTACALAEALPGPMLTRPETDDYLMIIRHD